MRYFYGELIGTYILSSSLNFMADYTTGQSITLLEIIVGMFIAVQCARKLSGAHLNPAVTLMFYMNDTPEERNRMFRKYKERILGQIAGGLLSPILSIVLTGNCFVVKANEETNYLIVFIMEMFASSVFYSVILFQSKPEFDLYNKDEVISSAIVALGLAGGISIAGNQSGAGLNPIISISQNIIYYLSNGDIMVFKHLPIYICAPLAASFVANFMLDFYRSEATVIHTVEPDYNQEFNNKIFNSENNNIGNKFKIMGREMDVTN